MDNLFFSRFMPKEPKFVSILMEIANVMFAASELLIEFIQNYDHTTAADYYKKIKEKEREGDILSNKVFDELNTTFITPFDREDINHLAERLDDVTDRINSCAKRMLLYNPARLPEGALELAILIRQGADCIVKTIEGLGMLKNNTKSIKGYCAELHDIENRADDVYEHFVIELFEKEKNGIELIKVKEIMNELEKATDVTEYVGKIIQTIIVKYA
jgi:uncharacterized protein